TTNNVWLTDNGPFSSILDDDPTIAPYTDYPQCQPRLPRLVSEEAVPFHVYAEEFGRPMPFDRLPYNVVQTGQSTVEISPGVTVNANDPLGWFRDTITPQQTTQYVQGFGPTSWAYGSYLKDNLYKLTFATHSGLDYGALDSPFILRVIVSVCDGLI